MTTDTPERVRSVSYGAGVQSTALLVLAAKRQIDFPLFLFANVGADSEHPDSLDYLERIAKPYAEAHGIELVELHRIPTKGASAGQVETLYGRLVRPGSRSLPIPVRMSNGAPGTRSCTADFKVRVVAKELKRRGATVDNPALVALGISTDEIQRAKPGIDPQERRQERTYPLLDLGLSRTDCKRIITEAGLPVPGKSSCYFCPFHDKEAWRALKRDTPDLFAKSVELERTLNERRDELGKDHVYLTRHGIPLDQAIDDQLVLDGFDGCDSGYCFT
jgi:hypothetical protein